MLPYEQVALKDVVWLNTGETVRVIARFAPWDGEPKQRLCTTQTITLTYRPGLYMFHCHNLIHEDHAMMAAFNVTSLTDLGYSEKTHFIDPMEPAYRAKGFSESDFTGRLGPFSDGAIQDNTDGLSALDAYKDIDKVEEALVSYWATASTLVTVTGSASKTTTTSSATSTSSGSTSSNSAGTSSISSAATTSNLVTTTSSSKTEDKTKTSSSSSTKASSTSSTKS